MKQMCVFFVFCFASLCQYALGQERGVLDGKRFSGEITLSLTSQHNGDILGFPFTLDTNELHVQPGISTCHVNSGVCGSLWLTNTPNGRDDLGDEADFSIGVFRSTRHFDWHFELSRDELRALPGRNKLYSAQFFIGSKRDGFAPYLMAREFGSLTAYLVGLAYNHPSYWTAVEVGSNDGFLRFERTAPAFTRIKIGKSIGRSENWEIVGAYQKSHQEFFGLKAQAEGFWLEAHWSLSY